MNKVRFRYTKTDKARYISHLDLMATMQRAFLRAAVELNYSQGFNPHPYMSVALPLPVGCESVCELIDVGLAGDMIPKTEIIQLPNGITIYEAYKSERKFSEISWIKIACIMRYPNPVTKGLAEKLKQHFSKDSIIVPKRTKRGLKDIDIAPHIKDVEVYIDDFIIMDAKISAQNPTLNAGDIESAIGDGLKPDYLELRRIEIYDSEMNAFR